VNKKIKSEVLNVGMSSGTQEKWQTTWPLRFILPYRVYSPDTQKIAEITFKQKAIQQNTSTFFDVLEKKNQPPMLSNINCFFFLK